MSLNGTTGTRAWQREQRRALAAWALYRAARARGDWPAAAAAQDEARAHDDACDAIAREAGRTEVAA